MDKVLTSREKDIIINRFGLFGTQPLPLRMFQSRWNCSRERIRQIEKISLKKLRVYLKDKVKVNQ